LRPKYPDFQTHEKVRHCPLKYDFFKREFWLYVYEDIIREINNGHLKFVTHAQEEFFLQIIRTQKSDIAAEFLAALNVSPPVFTDSYENLFDMVETGNYVHAY
jgi:hypothetical protein